MEDVKTYLDRTNGLHPTCLPLTAANTFTESAE